MGSERRGRAVQGRLEVNPSGEEPTDRPRQKNAGLWEPYDGRLSRTVLREREGEVPSRHSPRSKAALANRLRTLGDAASAIEAVVIDPFAPYRAAVRELLPHAVHVADRFHIERLANTAVTDTRCRVQQQTTGHRGRKGDPLYTARRDLTRAQERLTDRGRLRLEAAFDADDTLDLKSAWILKEALRDLYDSTSRRQAERELADWHRWAAVYDVEETKDSYTWKRPHILNGSPHVEAAHGLRPPRVPTIPG